MIIKTTLTVLSVLMLMFLSLFGCGLIVFLAINPLSAREIMPYEAIGENDNFSIVLNVNSLGYDPRLPIAMNSRTKKA